ncbi:MAG: uncharacterized protein A8A55_0687 [Amphiamblys sp. WSBS2006]|nr:MAG: uncharacterized protein A8A55_0687 [Amphiamblys sp. WSBS2006]
MASKETEEMFKSCNKTPESFLKRIRELDVDWVSLEITPGEIEEYKHTPVLLQWEGSSSQRSLSSRAPIHGDREVGEKILEMVSRYSGVGRDAILEKSEKEVGLFVCSLMKMFPVKERYNELVCESEQSSSGTVVQEKILRVLLGATEMHRSYSQSSDRYSS